MSERIEKGRIEEILDTDGVYASNTKGVSMQPLFRTHRDVVIVRKPEGVLKKYDVALYRDRTGRYVLHRIIKVKPDIYIIRGDNTYTKERVAHSSVIGVLTEFTRKGKHGYVTDKGYLLYARVWVFIYPVRAAVFFVKSFFKRAFKKVLRIFKGNKK